MVTIMVIRIIRGGVIIITRVIMDITGMVITGVAITGDTKEDTMEEDMGDTMAADMEDAVDMDMVAADTEDMVVVDMVVAAGAKHAKHMGLPRRSISTKMLRRVFGWDGI